MKTSKKSDNQFMNDVQQQMQQLKSNKTSNFQNRNEKKSIECSHQESLIRINWVQIILTTAILVILVVVLSKMLLNHQINIEKKDVFLKNLELLKAKQTFNIKQNNHQTIKNFKKIIKPYLDSGYQQQKINSLVKTSPQGQNHQQKQPQVSTSHNMLQKIAENSQELAKLNVKNNNLFTRRKRGQTTIGSGVSSALLLKARSRLNLINQDISTLSKLGAQQIKYMQDKYKISKYNELPICVVVPTFNNAINHRYLDNIKSIVMQNYSNFHIVVIDDASKDNTGNLILNYLQKQTKVNSDRYSVIRNAQQMHTMFNLRFAAKNYCKPSDIFIIVDGDDYLVGRQVFKLYNAKFQADDLWFMYTNFMHNQGKIGYSRPFPQRIMKDNNYRNYPFVTSHLRAFYTKLFLNIKQQDLRDEKGEYLNAANDVAICLPVLQQAHLHVQYVPEITYFYNSNTGLNNHAIRLAQQRSNDRKLRKKKKYQQLKSLQ